MTIQGQYNPKLLHIIHCITFVLDLLYTACGGTYSEPEGSFSSPSYPNAYPANKECVYTINQSPGSVVTLSFTAFDLEGSTNCIYDYLTVIYM